MNCQIQGNLLLQCLLCLCAPWLWFVHRNRSQLYGCFSRLSTGPPPQSVPGPKCPDQKRQLSVGLPHSSLCKLEGVWRRTAASVCRCCLSGVLWMCTPGSCLVASFSCYGSWFTLLAQASDLIQAASIFVKYQLWASIMSINSFTHCAVL